MRLAEQTNSAPEITGRDDYRNATPRNFTHTMIITFIQSHPLFCYAFGSVLALGVGMWAAQNDPHNPKNP